MEATRGRTLGSGQIDRDKVLTTTDEDTRRYLIEDGLDPDNPLAGFRPLVKAVDVRQKANLSQAAFARALHVPVKTIRNWEQQRSKPDPAAQALLRLVAHDPAHAFAVLDQAVPAREGAEQLQDWVAAASMRTGPNSRRSEVRNSRRGN